MLTSTQSRAQSYIDSTDGGYYNIQRFSASEYGAEAQNWDVEQAENGLIYVANNHGVLEFDGVNWRLIKLPQKGVVRSLAKHHDGNVYVSSNGDIGVLKPDSLGIMAFESQVHLLPAAERLVDNALRVMSLRDGVYYQGRDRLIRILDNTSTIWRPPDTAVSLHAVRDTVYLNVQDHGLMQLKKDSLVLAPGGATFNNHRIAGVFSYNADSYLVITAQNGMFTCSYALPETASCSVFRPAVSDILESVQPYNAVQLPDASIAISTYGRGLFFMNKTGDLTHQLTVKGGLSSNTVMGFAVDHEYGLWLASANGVDRISLEASMTVFDESLGFDKSPTGDVVRHNNKLYIASFQGVYSLSAENQQFIREPFIQDQCPAILSTRQGLLAGCRNGIYNLDKKTRIEVPEGVSTYDLYQPSWDSTRIYLALLDGLAWLELQEDMWRYVDRLDIDVPAYKLMEDKAGRMWLSTIKDGIYSLEYDPEKETFRTKQYGQQHGVPAGLIIADKLAGEVVFKVWDGSGLLIKPVVQGDSISFIPHAVYDQMPPPMEKRILNFVEDEKGWVWIFNREHSSVAIPQGNGDYSYKPITLRIANLYNAYSMYSDSDDILWVVSTEGLVRLKKKGAIPPDESFIPLIRTVTTSGSRLLHGGENGNQEKDYTWPHTTDNLRFHFAAPQYEAPGLTQFRTRLSGLEEEWSSWTKYTNRDFTNLPAGMYTFDVQARNGYGVLSEMNSFSFEVLPSWNRTAWAYWLWVLLGGLALGAIMQSVNRLQTRRLQARNDLLNQLVEEKTEEVRDKNDLLQEAYEEVQATNNSLLQVNEALQERTDRLRDALEVNKEILGITAHDLKNPLGGIIGLAEMVILDAEEDPQSTHKSVIDNVSLLKDEAERMLFIVKELLDKHRDGDEIALKKERIILGDIIATVLRWNGQQALNKNITLHYDSGPTPVVDVDVVSIQRVLDNYISNAIKYCPSGTSVWIRIKTLKPTSKIVRISVQDEGPGLTDEDKRKVFGKMQRLSATPTGGEHSTGLGLYFVKNLVEAHGGSVGVDSEVGKGATFWIQLPCITQNTLNDALAANYTSQN